MSNKPAVNTEQKSTTGQSAPLGGPQGQLFGDVWQSADTALKGGLSTPVPSNFVAGPTGAQWQGTGMMLDKAPSLGGGADATQDMLNKIASGYFLNPNNDPNFQSSVTAALQPGFRDLTQKALPQVQDISLRASGGGTGPAAYGGRGGGSPQDMLTQRVLQDWGQTAAATGAGMANTARGQGMALTSLIPQLAQSATSQALTPAAVTTAAGTQQQAYQQSILDNIIKQYFAQTQAPFQLLSSAAGVGAAGGFGNKFSNENTTKTGPEPNMMTQYLQGATGVASGANSLFGSGPQGSPSAASNMFSGLSSMGSSMSGWLGSLGVPAEVAAVAPYAFV